MLARLIQRQLARPSALAGRLMNVANARINRKAIDLLDLAPEHRVLEVGFGGGAVLARLVGRCAFVAGIDPSEAALRTARRRFQRDLDGGRLEIAEAEVASRSPTRDSTARSPSTRSTSGPSRSRACGSFGGY